MLDPAADAVDVPAAVPLASAVDDPAALAVDVPAPLPVLAAVDEPTALAVAVPPLDPDEETTSEMMIHDE